MNASYYKYCMVPQCESTRIKTPNKLFIFVPSNAEVRKKWLNLARRNDANCLSSISRMYFCEDHFDLPNDMLNYTEYHIMGKVSKVLLKPGCTPSKFECQEDRRKRTCSSTERPFMLKREKRMEIIAECLEENTKKNLERLENPEQTCSQSLKDIPHTSSACRVCLARDTRLWSIMDGQLRDIYEKLAEVSLNMDDMLPTSVCLLCFSKMKEILQFRDIAQKSNQILQQMLNSGLEPSISSLNMLDKNQSGISSTVDTSDIDKTTTCTSPDQETQIKIESLHSEIDIDVMSDQNEDKTGVSWTPAISDFDRTTTCTSSNQLEIKREPEMDFDENEGIEAYSNNLPVNKDCSSDSKQDLLTQNISDPCITEFVKVEDTPKDPLNDSSENEGAEPAVKREFDEIETEMESITMQAPLIITEEDKLSEKTEEKSEVSDLANGSKEKQSYIKTMTEKTQTIGSIGSSKSQNEKPYKCNICEKSFAQYGTLFNHLKIHSGEKRHSCSYCAKRFYNTGQLSEHMRIHTKEKPYKCDICEKDFSVRSNLTAHIRIHSGEKPYSCSYCNKRFTQAGNLSTHLNVHTKERPHKCDICKKAFSFRASLIGHMKIHSDERPNVCSYCNKSFNNSKNLTTHLKVHMKEKPYKCDICGIGFSLRYRLINHLRIHTGEKPHSCSYCNKTFSQTSSLNKHLRVHTDQRPYKCELCEKAFTLKGVLTRHYKTHSSKKPSSSSSTTA